MSYLSEKEYNIAVGKVLSGKVLEGDEALSFIHLISKFESLLDSTNSDDYFGTEGWQRHVNWDKE